MAKAPVQDRSSQADFEAGLERLWAENPELLAQAVGQNPDAFAFKNPSLFTAERTQPQSPQFDPDAYVADMNIASLNELIEYGPNLAGYGDRKAAIDAAKRRLAQINPTQVPTSNGMSDQGTQPEVSPTPNFDPGVAQGTNNTPIPDTAVDYGPGSDNDVAPWQGDNFFGNSPYVPPTNGMGPGGGQVGAPQDGTGGAGGNAGGGGGSTPPGGAFDPVGGGYGGPTPGSWGPHEDFYKHQFNRLLMQEDLGRQQAFAAAIRREQQQNQPQQQLDTSWDWANLPEVRTNDAAPGSNEAFSWGFNPAYGVEQGMTNEQVFQAIAGGLDPQQQSWVQQNFQQSPQAASGQFWANAGRPDAIINAVDPGAHPDWRATVEDIANLLYTREDLTAPEGGGPAAPPPGYAAPR